MGVNNNESNKMNSSNDRRQSTSNLSAGLSILGNFGAPQSNAGQSKPDFHLPKSISSFLKAGKGTLTRNKKDKTNQQPRTDSDTVYKSEVTYKSCLSPPAPPVLAPQPKLRRISSSTLSLSVRTKKKI